MNATPTNSETIVSKPGQIIAFPRKSSDGQLDHISPSALKDYLGCSLRFYFRRVLGLPEPTSTALVFGKAVHEALQAFWLARWRDGDTAPETITHAFQEAFERFQTVDSLEIKEVDREKLLTKGKALVLAYLDSDHAKQEVIPAGVEVRLEEDFASLPSPILGYIDLVLPGLMPVDYKTVASTPNVELEAFQHELQLTAYQLLIESATGQKVTSREIVYLVKTKEPRIIVNRMPPADKAAIARFWTIAERAVKGIYEENWYPQPGMHCSWCSYRQQCLNWSGKGHDDELG